MKQIKLIFIGLFFGLSVQAAEICGAVKSVVTQGQAPGGYSLSWKVHFENGKSIENVVARMKVQSLYSEVMEMISMLFDAGINSAIQGVFAEQSSEGKSPVQNILLCFVPYNEVYKFSGVSKG